MGNKIIKLNSVVKIPNDTQTYRIDFELINVFNYLRRDTKQHEISTQQYCIYIMTPSELTLEEQRNYIEEYWDDCIKHELTLEYLRGVKNQIDLKNEEIQIGRIYQVGGIERQRSFTDIHKVFRYICMNYDIQPSNLEFDSLSGYKEDDYKIHYDYNRYKEDAKE